MHNSMQLSVYQSLRQYMFVVYMCFFIDFVQYIMAINEYLCAWTVSIAYAS